jgi:glutamate N-acetyltransferase / amino-acid N-acetyltransferase
MAFRSSYGLATTILRKKPVHIQVQVRCFSKFDLYSNSPVPANKQQFVPTSGTYPKGFLVGSINVGIKPISKTQLDLVLVSSEEPSSGAAVFTKNEFPAASITVSRDLVRKTKGHGLRGVIANSWCANLFTGKAGLEDAAAMSKEAGKYVSGETGPEGESSVMVMHTGMAAQSPVTLHMKTTTTSMTL